MVAVEGKEGVDELGEAVEMVGGDGKVLMVKSEPLATLGGYKEPKRAHLPPHWLG